MDTEVQEDKIAVGELSIARVVEMEGPMMRPQDLLPKSTPEALNRHRSWLEPNYLTSGGILIMSIQSFVVRTANATILVDTCVGNDKQRDNPSWSNLNLPYLQNLQAVGYAPEDIDIVFCTHMHIDHVGWNTKLEGGRWVPTFPNARYLFTQEEWDFWKTKPPAQSFNHASIDDSILPVVESGQAEFVTGDHAVDHGAWLEHAPGHTPGHAILHLESNGNEAILAGDILHHPVQVAEPFWAAEALDVDPKVATETRISFLNRYSETDVLVLGSHFAHPYAGHIGRSEEMMRFRPAMAN